MESKTNSRRKGRRQTAPTHAATSAASVALLKFPVFRAQHFQRGMLYYDTQLTNIPLIGGSAVGYVFSANGLYDPNITGTGHQPMGFDQLMAFYEQYTVTNATITVRFNAYASTQPNVSAVYLSPDTTIQTSPGVTMENGLLKSVVTEGASGTYSPTKEITLNCDVAKYFNRDKRAMINDSDLQGTAAANPTEQVYFIISSWQAFALSTSQTIHFDVLLSYDAWFTEPRKLPAS